MTPIVDYLRELAPLLRAGRRRRIVAEVHAHLLDAAAADPLHRLDPQLAARHAVERSGEPKRSTERVARQFNALRRRPLAMLQRMVAVMLACAGMGTLGAATVWALEPGGAHPHRAHAVHPAPRPVARP